MRALSSAAPLHQRHSYWLTSELTQGKGKKLAQAWAEICGRPCNALIKGPPLVGSPEGRLVVGQMNWRQQVTWSRSDSCRWHESKVRAPNSWYASLMINCRTEDLRLVIQRARHINAMISIALRDIQARGKVNLWVVSCQLTFPYLGAIWWASQSWHTPITLYSYSAWSSLNGQILWMKTIHLFWPLIDHD